MGEEIVPSTSTDKQKFVCDICNMEFFALKGLMFHKKCHGNKKSNRCHICGKLFRDQYNLRRHVNSDSAHRTPIRTNQEKEVFHFDSKDAFSEWKAKMEIATSSQYVQHNGCRVNKDGSTVTYLHCHRDGFFNSKGKGIRNIKALGSNRINSHCPSMIVIKEQGSSIVVEFYASHSDHTRDLDRLSLPKAEKEDSANKIPKKMPLHIISDESVDSIVDSDVSQQHLTTKQDLHNVIVQYNLKKEEALDGSDCVGIDSWVNVQEIEVVSQETSAKQNETELSTECEMHFEETALVMEPSGPAQSAIEVQKAKVASDVQEILNLLDTEEKIALFRKCIAPVKCILQSMGKKRNMDNDKQMNREAHSKKIKCQRKVLSTKKQCTKKQQHLAIPAQEEIVIHLVQDN